MTPQPNTPTSPLRAQLLALIGQYERELAANHTAPTMATLLNLAQSYARTLTDDDRATLAVKVAHELTLTEAGTIRRAAAAVQLGTPDLIIRASTGGTDRATIARELGVSPRYIRRILRDYDRAQQVAELLADARADFSAMERQHLADTDTD